MPIPVVCPGCQKRFNVSDKFAGKKGPCPHCKTVIQVPEKGEEVVVHAPEEFGPKDAKGRAVLKPIARKETKVSPRLTAVILVTIVAVLAVAWMFRSPEGDVPTWLLVLGAIALAPPLLWGLVALVTGYVLGGDKVEVIHMVFIAPVMIGIGTFAAFLSLDLEAGTAAVHCSLYLLVTVTLRLILGLTAF